MRKYMPVIKALAQVLIILFLKSLVVEIAIENIFNVETNIGWVMLLVLMFSK